MKRFQTSVLFTALVCVSLAVAACSGGAGGSPTGGGANATAPAATATPKPKPTAVPKITVAFCQGIMTVAQANQIMHPPTPATTIRVDSTSSGGSCNYEYKPFLSVVSIIFQPYNGGPGSAQSTLNAAANKLAQVQTAKVTTKLVSGVGDAAMFVTVVLASPPLNEAGLDVLYGSLFLSCSNFKVQGSSFATQQTYLTQVCQQYISQL